MSKTILNLFLEQYEVINNNTFQRKSDGKIIHNHASKGLAHSHFRKKEGEKSPSTVL